MKKEKNFNWLDFIKKISVIAIPVALQNLLTTTGSMVDTVMISSLGEVNIGAVGLCGQFGSLMFSCYWGFVGGGMLFFSQYWGNGDKKGINRSYGMTLSLMMLVSVIFAALAFLAPGFVMKIYTDKASVIEVGKTYLHSVAFAYPLSVMSVAMSSLLRSTERVKIPLIASIASVCTNTFLNWVLIYGNLGAPALGVRGAAYATTVAAFVNLSIIIILCASTKYPFIFMITEHFKWDYEFIKIYLKKCFPIICNELFLGIANMLINIVLGHQSEEALAAIAVFRTIEGLIIGFFAGFSNAASVLVGKEVGAGFLNIAYERAKRIVYLCQSIIAVIVFTLFAVHSPLLHLMNLEGEAYRIGTGLILIYGMFCIIRMGNWTMNDTYRSAGDATTGTVLEIVFMYVLILPAVFIAWKVFNADFFIIFALCYIDEPIRYIIMQRHMYSGRWIRPVTLEGKEGLEAFLCSLRKKTQR